MLEAVTPRLITSLLFFLLGLFLMWRIPLLGRGHSGRVEFDDDQWPRISIIVPARNEEERIGPLLRSLGRQTRPAHEVVVVDDESSDATAAVAEELGARVVSGQPVPDGWTGKTWACWQGAQRSSGEVFIFLDADTWLEDDGLERIVRTFQGRGGLLTVQPYHVTHEPYEQLSAMFNIVLMAGMNAFTPLGDRLKPAGGFGPCLVCSKRDYFAMGGHSAVASEVLEDLAIGRLFRRHAFRVSCYGGRGAINFRMYPGGLGQLVQGWSKGFASGATSIRVVFLALVVAWITGCFAATSGVVTSMVRSMPATGLWLALYGLYAWEIHWMLRRVGRFRWWTSVLYPVPLLFFAVIMLRSMVMTQVLRQVTWRGRKVRVRPPSGED
jgi:4,4'-diaponeurosporenoate glycosyltransferase